MNLGFDLTVIRCASVSTRIGHPRPSNVFYDIVLSDAVLRQALIAVEL